MGYCPNSFRNASLPFCRSFSAVHPLGLPVIVDGTFGPLEETLDIKVYTFLTPLVWSVRNEQSKKYVFNHLV